MTRFVVACALAAAGLAASPRQDRFPRTWLEGTSGQTLRVRLFVETAGWPLEHGLWGTYYYVRTWQPIALEGDELPSGELQLFEGDPETPREQRARFVLRVTARGAAGTWTSADGTRTLPVTLARVDRPIGFKQAIQRPRRFADPRWPFSFTYPQGWFLSVDDRRLIVRTPDPRDMMLDNGLDCERGTLPPPPQAPARAVRVFESFYRTPAGWLVGTGTHWDCEDEENDCTPPQTRAAGGVTILTAPDISYRMYNAWGYAGMADRAEYLIVRGNEYAHCDDRLFDSPSRIQPPDRPRR